MTQPASPAALARQRLRLFVMHSRPYRRLRDVIVRAHRENMWVIREDLARLYIAGDGIEIGAATSPLRVPPGAAVRYVDRLAGGAIDVVDDATRLDAFADSSLDFVIANHVYEHVEDPIAALENALRVLRVGGVLFITIPDARRTFDVARRRTTVEHLLRDHAEGPEASRRGHYEEWARTIECLAEDRVPGRVEEFGRVDARHHFHVWELETFLDLLRAVPLPCELLEARAYSIEFAIVLRRLAA
jgi:SAM-dependent methyltransferase